MRSLYPEIEAGAHGYLDVGAGHAMYWETCGSPDGKPALTLHGGPGSGCAPWNRRLFDPRRYRMVLYDQRNAGRSRPHASVPDVDLSANTTPHLVDDIERLRVHLGIDRWLVMGGSWGSTLALAYAQAHPERVTELILFGVTAGLHREFDTVFRGGLADQFPLQWRRLVEAVAPDERAGEDVVDAVGRQLFDPDPEVRARIAYEWCLWESATPDWPPRTELQPRFRDPDYALAFSRVVTHYARHYAWLEDGVLMDGLDVLAEVPMVLVDGRHDPQSTRTAEEIARRLPLARQVIVEDAAHSAGNPGIASELVRATDEFAAR